MTRRTFFGGYAALLPGAPMVRLRAIAAPEMPRNILLPAHLLQPGANVYEFRTYESRTRVYAFQNLAARAAHWDAQRPHPGLTHLSLWAPIS